MCERTRTVDGANRTAPHDVDAHAAHDETATESGDRGTRPDGDDAEPSNDAAAPPRDKASSEHTSSDAGTAPSAPRRALLG
ncbi:hypothetical protein ACWDUN_24195 [Mycobacterium sp. NPDC003323]